jgi:hypothetical protein
MPDDEYKQGVHELPAYLQFDQNVFVSPFDILKDYIVTLSKDRQDALYRWMHETLDCRVYDSYRQREP